MKISTAVTWTNWCG